MQEIYFKEESYEIIGICMEVHRILGMGFKEEIHKDALEIEFKERGIEYEREKAFAVKYKGIQLKKRHYSDFVLYGKIILEVKATPTIFERFIAQTINYIKASQIKLGIVANFGQPSFTFKRVLF